MSAFVVSQTHIDALLTFAQRPQYDSPASYYKENGTTVTFYDNLNAIGQILLDENVRSVNFRYEEQTDSPSYLYHPYRGNLTPVQIIKACDCLNYQSCETDDWKNTEAHLILDTIRERAINELPGMDAAEWEITPSTRELSNKELADLPETWQNSKVDTSKYYESVMKAWEVDRPTFYRFKAEGRLCMVNAGKYYIA